MNAKRMLDFLQTQMSSFMFCKHICRACAYNVMSTAHYNTSNSNCFSLRNVITQFDI